MWEQYDVIVSSIDTAKRSPHREIVYEQDYDLIIIDEAHKLKNNKTKNYEFVQNLKKKFCLLLTATPIQNRIDEIFNLVSLLKPGHLGNQENFEESFGKKSRSIDDHEHLKELVNKVMIRNRRDDTGIEWTKRKVETVPIEFSETEQELYDAISAYRSSFSGFASSMFSILTLQREACSSREAVYFTLKKMLEKKNEDGSSAVPEDMVMGLMKRSNRLHKILRLKKRLN